MSKQMIEKDIRESLKKVGMDVALTYYIEKLGNAASIARQYGNLDDVQHYSGLQGMLRGARRAHRVHMGALKQAVEKFAVGAKIRP